MAGVVDLTSRGPRIAAVGPPSLLCRDERSREPPTSLGALVGVLTEERDDEERLTTAIRIRRYSGDGDDALEIPRRHQDQTASKTSA